MLERYERQKGLVDQEVLKSKKVGVAGLGGLGCPASVYLVLSGVGEVQIMDKDVVEISNLNRQFLYTEKDLGEEKVSVAEKRLKEMNPHVKVKITDDFSAFSCDVVLDCLDNWESRKKLWKMCLKKKIPIIHGAVGGWGGHVALIRSEESVEKLSGFVTRRESVIGPVCGTVGSLMTWMAVKYLVNGFPEEDFLIVIKDFSFEKFLLR